MVKVFDWVIDVFWVYGYDGVSLIVFVDEMGIGKKSFYDIYGNKC